MVQKVRSFTIHTALESRFDYRPGSSQVLTPEIPIEFTGVRISMEKGALADSYFMDQSEARAKFPTQHDMCDVRCRERALCLMLQNYFQIVNLFQQK